MRKPVGPGDIEAAANRIAGELPPTPMIPAHALSERLGRPLMLKCELMQKTGSFKTRGALNWMRTATPEELERGLITISAGNHALALAWAAKRAKARVTVVMPEGSSPVKVEATRALGAEVILYGAINEAMDRMEELRRERDLVLVHPFADPRIVAGQGTVGLEILDQCPEVKLVLCPVGGGGLISGLAVAVKSRRPDVRIVGLETDGAPTLRAAWDGGGPVRLKTVKTLAPSLGAALTGELNYELSRRHVDELLTLPDEDIRMGVRETFAGAKLFAEPGATLGIAALMGGRVKPAAGVTVAVVTGGNFDFEDARQFL